MTHQQKLEQLLAELGISYEKREYPAQSYASEEGQTEVAEWDVSIDLSEGVGLPGLVTSFYFDENEMFLSHRVWRRE